jgi:hypothetical protein
MKISAGSLPFLLPAGFLIKDFVATIVVLSNEPGISAANVLHYSLALLPASLVVPNGWAMPVNLLFGFLLGCILYLAFRKPRPRAEGTP